MGVSIEVCGHFELEDGSDDDLGYLFDDEVWY